MALQESGVKLKVTGEAELTKALKSVDSALKALDAATKKTAKGFDDLASSTKKLDKISNLNDKLAIQSRALSELQAKLSDVAQKYGIGSEQANKVQASIDKLTLSMRSNVQQVDQLTRELEQEKQAQQDRITVQAKAADAAGKAALAAGDLKEKLDQEASSQNRATQETLEGVTALNRVDDSAKQASRGIGSLDTTLKNSRESFSAFGEIATGALRRVGELVVNLAVEIGQRLGDALRTTITLSGDYEATLNRFGAVAGDAIQSAGLRLRDFDKLALQMGADTQFSAQQAAEAMVEMVKAGITPAAISAGGLGAVLNLASAGELDLGKSAEIAAKQMAVWASTGVTMAQTVDLLSQAANASTLNVEDLALGTYNAGGAARIAGLDYEEMVSTLALVSSGYASGAEAGTAFKSFLLRIVPKTGPAVAAFKDLGLITDELGNVFFDAEGKFLGVDNMLQKLQESVVGLSDEAANKLLGKAFGTYGIQVAKLLAEKGPEGLNEIRDSMEKTGAATEQAAKRQVGFNFALETLKGSAETLAIVIGKFLNPVITNLMNFVLIPATNAFVEFFSAIIDYQDTLSFIDEFHQGIEDVGKSVMGLGGDALEVIPETLSIAAQKSKALDEAIHKMAQSFKGIIPDSALDNLEHLLRVTYDLGVKIFPDLAKGADGAKASLSEIGGNILASAFDSLASALEFVGKNWGKIVSGVKTVQSVMSGAFGTIVKYKDVLVGAFAGLGIATGIAVIVGTLSALGAVLTAVLSPIGLLIAGVVALSAAWYTNFGGIQEVVASVVPYVTQAFNTMWMGIQQAVAVLVAIFTPLYEAIRLFGTGALAEIYNFVTGTQTSFGNVAAIVSQAVLSWGTLLTTVAGVIVAALPSVMAAAARLGLALVSWVTNAIPSMGAALTTFVTSAITYLGANLPRWIASFLVWATEMVTWIGRSIPSLLVQLSMFLQGFEGWASDTALPSIIAKAGEWAFALYDWIRTVLIPEIKPAFDEFLKAFQRALENIASVAWREGVRIAKQLIEGIIQSLREGASQVYNAVSNLFSGATATAEQVTESHSPSEVFARIGRNLVSGLVQGLQATGATGAVQSLFGPLVTTANNLLPQWVGMLAQFGNESWMWLQRAIPILRAQLTIWSQVILVTLRSSLPAFTSTLAMWTLEAWRWLQLALAPLTIQMTLFTTTLTMWAGVTVLTALRAIASLWSQALWSWIPNELIPSIQPQWVYFLEDSVMNMKKIEETMYKSGQSVGKAIIKGTVEAIKDGKGKIIQIFIEIINAAIATAKQELGIASPSKVFYTIGEQIMSGMTAGIYEGARGVTRALDTSVGSLAPSLATTIPLAFTPPTVPTMPDMTGNFSASGMVSGGSVSLPPMSANQINQRSVNNMMTYNNQKTYNLNVNSTQTSQGVVSDFYLMQAYGA